jgi:two-component system response regulator
VKAILLVDDNPDDVDLTMRAFRKGGMSHRVTVVHDGVEALDYLAAVSTDREAAEMPHLVLLDLKLPRLDGLQVLQRIRSNPAIRLLPVVILTSSTEERDLVNSYAHGANSYIRKPVDFQQFVQTLQQIGQYWLLANQPPPLLAPSLNPSI